PGVFVTPTDGRYVNLVSARRADAAWSPDGRTIVMAVVPSDPPGYNGDPDRVGDREGAGHLSTGGILWTAGAPGAPDANLASRALTLDRPRPERNAEAFDRVWSRTASLYYSAPNASDRLAAWQRLKTKYAAAAGSAPTDSALEDVIHRMLRERPPL